MFPKSSIQTLVSDFEYLSQNFPTITSIKPQTSSNGSLKFRVNYLHPNFRESTFHNANYLFSFNPNEEFSIQKISDFPSIENFVTAESFSPSKNFRAIIRTAPDKILLEIWGKNGLQKSVRISDYHGVVYADLEFTIEALSWSADEKRILYFAERKQTRPPRLFDHFKSEEEAGKALNNYGYDEDFGEMFKGKCFPDLFLYDFEEDQLSKVLNIPEGIIPSQASFTNKEGSSIVFCGYHFKELKLGMKFTANRESKIYYIPQLVLRGLSPKKISAEDFAIQEEKIKHDLMIHKSIVISHDDIAQVPIVSKDFTKLIYLYSSKRKTILLHFGIKMIDLSKGNLSTQTESKVIFEIPKDGKGDFFGITTYQNRLTRIRFLSNSNYFVFNSYSRSSLGLFFGNIETKEIRRIDKTKFKSGECRLDAVEGDILFTSFSNIESESNFAVFSGFDSSKNFEDALKNAKWHHFNFKPEESTQIHSNPQKVLSNIGEIEEKILNVNGMESVFFSLKETQEQSISKKKPLIFFLHGGPHGISTGFFSMIMYYALYRGYNVLYPNFTGTTGFSQESEERLLGNIGELDAGEVKATLEYCAGNGLADSKKFIAVGLSYGGFLTGVMLAKFPELFRVAVLQNPVASMVNMYEASDVPDWPLAEVLNIDISNQVTGDMYKKMYEASPLSMNKNIKTSILLMVGEKDKRVPLQPSLLYYRLLKSEGVDIQIALYPNDEHVLSGTPDSISDQFVRIFALIDEKLE